MEQCNYESVYESIDQHQEATSVLQSNEEESVFDVTVNEVYNIKDKCRDDQDSMINQHNRVRYNLCNSRLNPVENDKLNMYMKRIKVILIITIAINVAMLLLIITIATVGSVFSWSAASTSDLKRSFQVDSVHQGNLSLILNHLEDVNSDLQSLLTKLNTAENNVSIISANLNEARSNIVTLQQQVNASLLSCDVMTDNCGPGNWYRVVHLNMTDPTQQCPSNWTEYNNGGVRACGRPASIQGSCSSMFFPTINSYSRVNGRVIGYQVGSPDGFHTGRNGIDEGYVDGVSITHGSPRNHIWTYTAGATNGIGAYDGNCPCSSNYQGVAAPSFVGSNFYCESGNPTQRIPSNYLYSSDKLWDGQQCEGTCCTGTNRPPWFYVSLNATTNDPIEVRICGNYDTNNERTPIELLELDVQ